MPLEPAKKAPAGNRPSDAARTNPIPACALTAALAAIGGRWKLFVVYRLADGPVHFAALRRSLPAMTAKVLTQQLKEMRADGLVSRTRSGPIPAVVLYALTAHGRSVLPVAEAIRLWGVSHQAAQSGVPLEGALGNAQARCGSPLTWRDE